MYVFKRTNIDCCVVYSLSSHVITKACTVI